MKDQRKRQRGNIYIFGSKTITLHSPQPWRWHSNWMWFQVRIHLCAYLRACLCVSDHPQLVTHQSTLPWWTGDIQILSSIPLCLFITLFALVISHYAHTHRCIYTHTHRKKHKENTGPEVAAAVKLEKTLWSVTAIKLSFLFTKASQCVNIFTTPLLHMRMCFHMHKTYLQRESSQSGNGHESSHKKCDHVVNGRQSHAGAGATQAVSCPLL